MEPLEQQPPPPPPLPPAMKPSSFAMKIRTVPPGWYYEPPSPPRTRDILKPPTGPYFVYGTLQDSSMLMEILDLPAKPTLHPAEMVGYRKMMWGQYPALIKQIDAVITGMVFEVETFEQGARLAEYETKNYEATPCLIRYLDRKDEEKVSGFTFLFSGNERDLTEGDFDLNVWLRHMGRNTLTESNTQAEP